MTYTEFKENMEIPKLVTKESLYKTYYTLYKQDELINKIEKLQPTTIWEKLFKIKQILDLIFELIKLFRNTTPPIGDSFTKFK